MLCGRCTSRCAPSELSFRQFNSLDFVSVMNGSNATQWRWDLDRYIAEQTARMVHGVVFIMFSSISLLIKCTNLFHRSLTFFFFFVENVTVNTNKDRTQEESFVKMLSNSNGIQPVKEKIFLPRQLVAIQWAALLWTWLHHTNVHCLPFVQALISSMIASLSQLHFELGCLMLSIRL